MAAGGSGAWPDRKAAVAGVMLRRGAAGSGKGALRQDRQWGKRRRGSQVVMGRCAQVMVPVPAPAPFALAA